MPRKLRDPNYIESEKEKSDAANGLYQDVQNYKTSVESKFANLFPGFRFESEVDWQRVFAKLTIYFGGPIDDWYEWPIELMVPLINELECLESGWQRFVSCGAAAIHPLLPSKATLTRAIKSNKPWIRKVGTSTEIEVNMLHFENTVA